MKLSSLKPHYAILRVEQFLFERKNPKCPWLTPDAIRALQDSLKPTDVGFEFGSGRSTIWIAKRTKFLHSVEHDASWHSIVTAQIRDNGLAEKVHYQLSPETNVVDDLMPEEHPYVAGLTSAADNTLDFVLVDGIMRLTCVRLAIRKLKPGGLLILDNANRYVPNLFEEGHSTVRDFLAKPLNEDWAETCAVLSSWRGFNTSNGLSDTRFWIKPCSL